MGWGTGQFPDDWDDVVEVQNQATHDGSSVAQAVIKLMEDKEEYTGTSAGLHKTLESVAEELRVERDKAWPKSARWWWKRIKEALLLLTAVGIEAERGRDNNAKQITLRKAPKSNGTNDTESECSIGKPKEGANTDDAIGTSNGTEKARN